MDKTLKTVYDVKESLNEYFKLKQKYEAEIAANKKRIINNPTLSNREKRSEFMKLKPKCINCKRPGGSIFKVLFNADDSHNESYREYNARCGIISNPCNLKIKIRCGKTELITDILKNMEDEIKDIKNEIIDDKNKLLFGFLTTEDALDKFDYSKEAVSTYSSLYEEYLTKYNSIVDNEDKKRELEESITNSYIYINQIKDCVKKSDESGNKSFISDAINIYDTTLVPILFTIRNLKYNESFVWHNEDTNSCNLIQNKYSISNLLFSSFQSSVISFDTGYDAKKSRLIVESSESEEVLPKIQARPNGDIPQDDPIYGKGKDGIAWNIPEYNQLWDRLPIKLKNVIRPDNEWMKEFMFKCVNNRQKGKPCEIVAPKNLIIPPNKIEYVKSSSSEDGSQDGSQDTTSPAGPQYDFGVQIYSDLFNTKLEPSLQDTYLTLFSTKDGVKNYSMLIDAMNKLVAKETGFDRGYV
jgi:hypothetical protein